MRIFAHSLSLLCDGKCCDGKYGYVTLGFKLYQVLIVRSLTIWRVQNIGVLLYDTVRSCRVHYLNDRLDGWG